MEVEHTNPSSHPQDADQAGDNYRGNWHRRLRLRKSLPSSLTVKSMTEEEKAVTEPSQPTEDQNHQVLNTSSSKLTFTCTICNDDTVFSPENLLKHFSVFHGGQGDPPAFPCDLCNFATPEFTILQQHRMKHKEWRLTCNICNDSALQTLSQLTKHCKTQHSLNGQYHCGKCRFSTKEIKIFVYHSCPTSTESPVDNNGTSGIKLRNGELNGLHLAAADGASLKEEMLKNMSTGCHQGWRKKRWWKKKEVTQKHNDINTAELKFLLPKPETQWTSSEFLPFSATGLLDENGVLLNPARTLEETQNFLERTVNRGKKWPVTLKVEPQLSSKSLVGSLPLQPKIKHDGIPGLRNSGQNKISGLMEKNNISVPADCTTKVVGFKMVDGKKHLVLKVIPSSKTEFSPEPDVSSDFNTVELNIVESRSQIERHIDQACSEQGNITTKNAMFSFCNPTSNSGQREKLREKQHEDLTEDALQVENTENCNEASCVFTAVSGAPPQVAASGMEEKFNVANKRNIEKQLMFPAVISDSNHMQQPSEIAAQISVEVSSLREVDVQSLHVNIKEAANTKTSAKSQEEDLKRNRPEFTTFQNGSDYNGDSLSSIPSSLGHLKEVLTLSEEERHSKMSLNEMNEKLRKDTLVTQSHLLYLNEQKIDSMPSNTVSCSLGDREKEEAIFELNTVNPTFVSLHKHNTEPLFNSPSENGDLLLQDSCDECTNNVDPRDASLPLEQSSASETVEEPNSLAILSDSCQNRDLYQTLEELPVTTICHLLDDPEVTSRGITKHSDEPNSLSTQQGGLQSSKAIPVTPVVSTEKDSTQSNLCLPNANEPAMKRKRPREPTARKSQQPFSKSRKQLVQNSPKNDSPASTPYWEPIPQTVERTLRLLPVCSSQPVKVPRVNQPVIVLNHPDTDIPEVANIMKVVHKHKGAVEKVVLSQGTLKALSALSCETFRKSNYRPSQYRRVWPQGTVKERFILKLKLKRLCGHKFKVVPSATKTNGYHTSFRCWFCGRLFRNQETWVGHGQRHLMEATRDWNKLFNSKEQRNSPFQPYFH